MRLLLAFALVGVVPRLLAANPPIDAQVQAVFAELRTLRPMEQRQTYTLPARGEKLTGRNDDFLRRRTADEISASKLSCGCGDFATVFVDRIGALGCDALLIDSAQISVRSLINTNDGHVVVAIRPRDAPAAPWWLIDSTALNIISRDWSLDAKSFTTSSGSLYWIGYCGPIEKYAVRSPEELKKFYARTLAQVPAEIFSQNLCNLVFTVDQSLRSANGELLNPRVTRLESEQREIFARYGIRPTREVPVLLVRGRDDASSDLTLKNGQWVSRVGLQSACSPSFLNYLQERVGSEARRGKR